jgi:hypothetical protein
MNKKVVCPKWRECQNAEHGKECPHIALHSRSLGCREATSGGSRNPEGCPKCVIADLEKDEDLLLGVSNG